MDETEWGTLLALLAAIAIALFIAIGGDDAQDLERHGQWMAQSKERGAVVLW